MADKAITIQERIYELINERGITPNALANALDISATSVYKWFNPKENSKPSLDNLIKFLSIYEISPFEFIQGFDLPQLTEEQQCVLQKWSILDREEKDLFLCVLDKITKEKRNK